MAEKLGRISPSPIEALWLKDQFDQLHREHALILKKIDDIQTVINPALELQVLRALKLSSGIDQKVPDISPSPVPPSTQNK